MGFTIDLRCAPGDMSFLTECSNFICNCAQPVQESVYGIINNTNVFEQECPELWKHVCSLINVEMSKFPVAMFYAICLGSIYDERGRVGLREAEENFKKEKQKFMK